MAHPGDNLDPFVMTVVRDPRNGQDTTITRGHHTVEFI